MRGAPRRSRGEAARETKSYGELARNSGRLLPAIRVALQHSKRRTQSTSGLLCSAAERAQLRFGRSAALMFRGPCESTWARRPASFRTAALAARCRLLVGPSRQATRECSGRHCSDRVRRSRRRLGNRHVGQDHRSPCILGAGAGRAVGLRGKAPHPSHRGMGEQRWNQSAERHLRVDWRRRERRAHGWPVLWRLASAQRAGGAW